MGLGCLHTYYGLPFLGAALTLQHGAARGNAAAPRRLLNTCRLWARTYRSSHPGPLSSLNSYFVSLLIAPLGKATRGADVHC
jgi:hypothetical protein